MTLFSFDPAATLSTVGLSGDAAVPKSMDVGTLSSGTDMVGLVSGGQALKGDDFKDQFVPLLLSPKKDGPRVLESSQVTPAITGGTDKPDVLTKMQLEAFHLGRSEDVDKKTRATLRITLGKDKSSTDKLFDTVFWSVAAGLQLYDAAKGAAPDPKELNADLDAALGKRPIEVPGGLGLLSFEVVKHKEPPWWKRIFGFLESGTGQALVSALGFPALTLKAVGVVDELLERLGKSDPEVLFKSRPLRLALSNYAKTEFTQGSETVRVGSLTPGRWLLARGRDYDEIVSAEPVFWPAYGKLFPQDASTSDILNGKEGALGELTYGVIRIGISETQLDPKFDYGG